MDCDSRSALIVRSGFLLVDVPSFCRWHILHHILISTTKGIFYLTFMRMGEILSQGFRLTWQHPWFWIIGFAMYPQLLGKTPIQAAGSDFEANLAMLGVLLLYVLAIGTIAFVSYSVLQPGLILATMAARSGSPRKATEALGAGFEFALRFAGITLMAIGAWIAITLMLVVPVVIAYIVSVLLAVVVGLLFFPVVVVLGFVVSVVSAFTYRNVASENMQVREAVTLAIKQFLEKKWQAIGLALVVTLISVVIAVPLSLGALVTQLAVGLGTDESMIAALLVYVVTAILSVIVIGFLNAFSNVCFTVAYQEWFPKPAQVAPPAMDSQTSASL